MNGLPIKTNLIAVDDGVLFSAFRYSLGRRTYVVSETVRAIEENAHRIQRKLRDQIIKEISEALNTNRAGMEMDANQWRHCRSVLQESLKKVES